MANEESAREKKQKKASYEKARMSLKRSGRTDSIAAAMKSGNLPSKTIEELAKEAKLELERNPGSESKPIQVKSTINSMNLARSVIEGAKIFRSSGSVQMSYEEMNNRQQAAGQLFQNIAFQIVNDPNWQEKWMAVMGPDTVIKMFDFGVKIERQAMAVNLALANKKENEKENAGDGELDLAGKLLKNTSLIDEVHGLVDDDELDD